MGAVKIDIHSRERDYYNSYSFSSVDDLYDLLNKFDVIFNDYKNGNCEALAIICDFEELMSNIDNNVLYEYYSVQIGNGCLNKDNYNESIVQIISDKLNITIDECEHLLLIGLEEIVNKNYDLWINWINKNYKNYLISVKKEKKPDRRYLDENGYKEFDDAGYWAKDYQIKYMDLKRQYQGEKLPSDLQELIDIDKKNNAKLKILKSLNKENKTKEVILEIKKRISFEIELHKDISILKKFYEIPIKNTNKTTSISFVSYNSEIEEHSVLYQNQLEANETNIIDKVKDQIVLHKIYSIADKILTKRQLIVFKLYYENGLTQEKIAEIIGSDKRNITNDLKIIIKKIKNILKTT